MNGGYLLTIFLAFLSLPGYLQHQVLRHRLPAAQSDFLPPISLVVLAYNEEKVIIPSVRSLLQLDYPAFEIVIVNDGSKDRTLEVLKEEFKLVEFPEAFRCRINHKPVRAVYQSTVYPELRRKTAAARRTLPTPELTGRGFRFSARSTRTRFWSATV